MVNLWSVPANTRETRKHNKEKRWKVCNKCDFLNRLSGRLVLAFFFLFSFDMNLFFFLHSTSVHTKLVRLATVKITRLSRGVLIWQMVLIIKGHTQAQRYTHTHKHTHTLTFKGICGLTIPPEST